MCALNPWRRFVLCTLACLLSASPSQANDKSESLVDFDTEVMPVLTRHGCNAGSCHGAAIGRGGFQLSLLGSNATDDHDSIVRELQGRRVNLRSASRSLLLRKPAELVGHEGGEVLPEDSAGYRVVKKWIEQGALRSAKPKGLASLEITPAKATIQQVGTPIRFRVVANFDDGSVKEVTDWTILTSNDPDAISINGPTAVVHRRGIHVLIARFLDVVRPIRIVVPLRDQPIAAKLSSHNRVDDFINEQLVKLNLAPTTQASDSAILRRLTLDLAGRLPTADETASYCADTSPNKKPRLIERLLGDDEFAEYWALKWANLLSIDSRPLGREGAKAYHRWLIDQLAHDRPLSDMTREMLTSFGDSHENGAINFLRFGNSPGDLAEHVSEVLMGVRLRCANCHNHPLDHWKQDDYHGLAAIFAKVKRGRIVTLSDRGDVTHPVTGQAAIAKIPGGNYLASSDNGPNRFADWITSDRSPHLARVAVNRAWKQLMGRGLVEPVDDMRATNPATHPELLDWLAKDFIQGGFRIKRTIKTICQSNAYGRVARVTLGEGSELDDGRYASHRPPRALEAEVLADMIADATGVPLEFEDASRAVALTNNRASAPYLDVLGRCDRSETCSSTSAPAMTLARSLNMINGSFINERLGKSGGQLAKLVASTDDDLAVCNELYQLTLSREMTSTERSHWGQQLAEQAYDNPKTRQHILEDIFWSLLTSEAFLMNH